MKIVGYYLLTLATFGQFSFVWTYLMAKEAQLDDDQLHSDTKLFVPLYVLYIGFLFFTLYYQKVYKAPFIHEYFYVSCLAFAIALCLIWLLFKWLFRIASHIRSNSIELPNNFVLFLLLCVYAITLPLLQNKLNHVKQNSA